MNDIQQISLKLQMGLEPTADISPGILREMWNWLLAEREARGRSVFAQRNRRSVACERLENPTEN